MTELKCPYCGYDRTEVQETTRKVDSITRNRLCLNCGETFKTIEELEENHRRGRKPKRRRNA